MITSSSFVREKRHENEAFRDDIGFIYTPISMVQSRWADCSMVKRPFGHLSPRQPRFTLRCGHDGLFLLRHRRARQRQPENFGQCWRDTDPCARLRRSGYTAEDLTADGTPAAGPVPDSLPIGEPGQHPGRRWPTIRRCGHRRFYTGAWVQIPNPYSWKE